MHDTHDTSPELQWALKEGKLHAQACFLRYYRNLLKVLGAHPSGVFGSDHDVMCLALTGISRDELLHRASPEWSEMSVGALCAAIDTYLESRTWPTNPFESVVLGDTEPARSVARMAKKWPLAVFSLAAFSQPLEVTDLLGDLGLDIAWGMRQERTFEAWNCNPMLQSLVAARRKLQSA